MKTLIFILLIMLMGCKSNKSFYAKIKGRKMTHEEFLYWNNEYRSVYHYPERKHINPDWYVIERRKTKIKL